MTKSSNTSSERKNVRDLYKQEVPSTEKQDERVSIAYQEYNEKQEKVKNRARKFIKWAVPISLLMIALGLLLLHELEMMYLKLEMIENIRTLVYESNNDIEVAPIGEEEIKYGKRQEYVYETGVRIYRIIRDAI